MGFSISLSSVGIGKGGGILPPVDPGTVAVSQIGLTTAEIVFLSPASGGDGSFSYQWQRAPDSGGSPGAWANVGSDTDDLMDTGLSAPGVTYWWRCNVTSGGQSATTPAIDGTTFSPADISGLVMGVSIKDILLAGTISVERDGSGGVPGDGAAIGRFTGVFGDSNVYTATADGTRAIMEISGDYAYASCTAERKYQWGSTLNPTNFTILLAYNASDVASVLVNYILGGASDGVYVGGSLQSGVGEYDGTNDRQSNVKPSGTNEIFILTNDQIFRGDPPAETSYSTTGTLTDISVNTLFTRAAASLYFLGGCYMMLVYDSQLDADQMALLAEFANYRMP